MYTFYFILSFLFFFFFTSILMTVFVRLSLQNNKEPV